LAVTLSGATTSAVSTEIVTVQPGDVLSMRHNSTGTPDSGGCSVTLEFNGASSGQSGHAWTSSLNASTNFAPLLGSGTGWTTVTALYIYSLAACDGTLTEYRIDLTGAPGAGLSRTFVVVKNEVVQDGSGGTVDTQVTISDTDTTATASFSLSVTAGDYLRIRATSSGAPTDVTCAAAVRFVASADHISNLSSWTNGLISLNPSYNFGACGQSSTWISTESSRLTRGPASTVQLSHLHVRASATITAATFTARKNQNDTAAAVTLSGAIAGADTSNSFTISSADTFGIEGAGSFGLNRGVLWAFRLTGVSEFVGPEPSVQAVTQLVIQVATDEELDLDPPNPVAECVGGGDVATAAAPS
jgi:hypothetical protein